MENTIKISDSGSYQINGHIFSVDFHSHIPSNDLVRGYYCTVKCNTLNVKGCEYLGEDGYPEMFFSVEGSNLNFKPVS
jgi:hypothetical protein